MRWRNQAGTLWAPPELPMTRASVAVDGSRHLELNTAMAGCVTEKEKEAHKKKQYSRNHKI